MSDLSATNCGCGCERGERGRNNFSCIWIILILFFCCGDGFGWGREGGSGCECIFIILILFCCCGGNGFFGRDRFDDGCC